VKIPDVFKTNGPYQSPEKNLVSFLFFGVLYYTLYRGSIDVPNRRESNKTGEEAIHAVVMIKSTPSIYPLNSQTA
jgi:hypothetical protein